MVGAEKVQSKVNSSSLTDERNVLVGWPEQGVESGIDRTSASHNPSLVSANGRVFNTSDRCPGRSGLVKAYRSVMSAAGSASARGPEM